MTNQKANRFKRMHMKGRARCFPSFCFSPLFIFFALNFASCASARIPENLYQDIAVVSIAGKRVVLEVADEERERLRGLQFRKTLPKDHGMIFVFEKPRELAFWMKDTYIDLDIAYLDETGRILEIYGMTHLSEKAVVCSQQAQYAIEMPAGWFKKNHVSIGEFIEISAVKERLVKEPY